jgi:hypothetical protein
MEMNKQSRGQFLKTLGLSSKALMAVYCLGLVSACSSEEETVTPDPNTGNTGNNTSSGVTGTTTGASIDFTIDLKNASYSKLTTDGEFAVIGAVIVANALKLVHTKELHWLTERTKKTSFVATTDQSLELTGLFKYLLQHLL